MKSLCSLLALCFVLTACNKQEDAPGVKLNGNNAPIISDEIQQRDKQVRAHQLCVAKNLTEKKNVDCDKEFPLPEVKK